MKFINTLLLIGGAHVLSVTATAGSATTTGVGPVSAEASDIPIAILYTGHHGDGPSFTVYDANECYEYPPEFKHAISSFWVKLGYTFHYHKGPNCTGETGEYLATTESLNIVNLGDGYHPGWDDTICSGFCELK